MTPEAARELVAGTGPSPAPVAERRARMLREVREGLGRPQKMLPPKYFYDVRGSRLFEAITRLPEYYLTRVEREILERWAPSWIARERPRTLVELGAGSASKTRILLDAMQRTAAPLRYVPVDISADFLAAAARELRREYPLARVSPAVADISAALPLPDDAPRPLVVAFLGSSIGNFESSAAAALLRRVRAGLESGDRLLLGVDLRKDVAVLEAAYDDAAGLTAEFNRNVLHVLNRELGADFAPALFEHRALYEPLHHWIEMHLVALRDMQVSIPGIGRIGFAAGESIRTETSAKYDRATIAAMFAEAGLALLEWETDEAERFALVVGAPAE